MCLHNMCVFVSVWCRHTDTVISEKGRPWMKETWPTSCQSRYKHKHYSTNTHSLAPINSSLKRNSNIAGRLFFPFFWGSWVTAQCFQDYLNYVQYYEFKSFFSQFKPFSFLPLIIEYHAMILITSKGISKAIYATFKGKSKPPLL